jgi:hypothetical protein
MIHWLQSLSENGFDVFIVVYLAVLLLVYHYLMRWYINLRLDYIAKQLDEVNSLLNHVIDEIEE